MLFRSVSQSRYSGCKMKQKEIEKFIKQAFSSMPCELEVVGSTVDSATAKVKLFGFFAFGVYLLFETDDDGYIDYTNFEIFVDESDEPYSFNRNKSFESVLAPIIEAQG